MQSSSSPQGTFTCDYLALRPQTRKQRCRVLTANRSQFSGGEPETGQAPSVRAGTSPRVIAPENYLGGRDETHQRGHGGPVGRPGDLVVESLQLVFDAVR